MKISFRVATIKDLQGIINLCNECFNENTSLVYAKSKFMETRKNNNDIYIIGVMNNEIVSHAKITIIDTIYEEMNRYAILNHVCVKPIYRRNGIAKHMLDYILKVCKNNKCKNIELWSKNFRIEAHSLYKNYGFKLEEAGFFSYKVEEDL